MDLDVCEAYCKCECGKLQINCRLVIIRNDLQWHTLQIHWEARFDRAVNGQTCFCSLDGLDLKIQEPTPFSPKWFSHKFRGPGLRYEIALNIRTGEIVWVHGGYPCGLYPDLKLAREAYVLLVNPGELTVADKGYNDALYFIQKTIRNVRDHGTIMARHETVNKRMKQFKILKNTYRHSLQKHPLVFHAVANLTQLMIQNGYPLFSVFL